MKYFALLVVFLSVISCESDTNLLEMQPDLPNKKDTLTNNQNQNNSNIIKEDSLKKLDSLTTLKSFKKKNAAVE